MRICLSCDGIAEATPRTECPHCGGRLFETSEVAFPVRRGEADAAHGMIGRSIDGKYRLLGVLGKGGMGTVFRAFHEISLVPVALKLLHRRFARRPEYRSWFLDEARKAGRVTHEHSARILDVGETDDGTVYLAMEIAMGPTLDVWLGNGKTLEPGVVVELMSQVARALEAAHAVDVVHRDLSPRNIAVTTRDARPFAKVLDFGIAKAPPPSERLGADDGAPLGAEVAEPASGYANPTYAAPEHLAGHDVDARGDLYSLGVIAYQALTGRLPARGRDVAEMTRAKLAGELESLRAGSGVPRRLARLVNALLERDPARRPDSAGAVVAELTRITRAGASRGIEVVAAIAAMAAASLALFAFGSAPPRYLLTTADVAFALAATAQDVRAVELRSERLASWRFEYQGFEPARLEVALSQRGRALGEFRQTPIADRGHLTLRADQPVWRAVLDRITESSSTGPVDLEFRVRGAAPLGYARVRFDDAPPQLAIEVDALGEQGAWIGATRVMLDLDDGPGRVVDYMLRLQLSSRDESLRLEPERRSVFDLADLFGDLLPGVLGHGPATMWIEARDAAGNVAKSDVLDTAHFDLRVPRIIASTARLTYDSGGASVRLQLDAAEPDVDLSLRGPDGSRQPIRELTVLGDRLDVLLAPRAEDPPFVDGQYRIRLEDRWGNSSREFEERWTFERRDPALSFGVESGGAARRGARGIYSDGSGFELSLGCGAMFEPRRVRVRDARDRTVELEVRPAPSDALRGWSVDVPALADGPHAIEVSLGLVDAGGQDLNPETFVLDLAVQNSAPRVRLPDAANARFSTQLLDAAVLRRVPASDVAGNDLWIEGPAWEWSIEDFDLLRGRVWSGSEAGPALVARDVTPDAARGVLAPGLPLRRGRNLFGLELHDVLGRPLEVWIGDRRADLLRGPATAPGSTIFQVADFYDDPRACGLLEPSIGIEHGHAARFTVRCQLPLAADTRVELQLGGGTFEPRARRLTDATGVWHFDFVVDFARIASEIGVTSVGADRFREFGEFVLPVRLHCEAGEFVFDLRFSPIRSALVPVRLGEFAPTVDPHLAALELVPSLGIEGGFEDPLPPQSLARAAYRALPDRATTRNVREVYVQRDETTRAQYRAIVDGLLARLDAGLIDDAARASLVHAADPLGNARLTAAAMVPTGLGDDPVQRDRNWLAALRADPDRPVHGVEFFQAFTAARALGLLVAGIPSLLRLPFGVELEVAAGLGDARGGAAAQGTVEPFARVGAAEFAAAQDGPERLAEWPPTATHLRELGDVASNGLGFDISGLDFGVAEWVEDLPFSHGLLDEALLREWLSDHQRHRERAAQFAAGDAADLPIELGAYFARVGVVRGLGYGQLEGLIDGLRGERWPPRGTVRVPGVVRCRNARRDGVAPSGVGIDPALRWVGMRLVGGAEFIARVRAR